MAINDPARIFDGCTSFIGGMDGGSSPNTIPATKVAKAVNVTFRQGQVTTRPGYERVTLQFPDAPTAAFFPTGNFQGACHYFSPGGAQLIVVVSGRVFRLMFETPLFANVVEITPNTTTEGVVTADPNSATVSQAYLCQADTYLVIQDGIALPIIYDGNTCVRAGFQQVPTGTVMAYGMGRLWVALGNSFMAGDLIGTSPTAAISFTETIYLNGGGSFSFPSELGNLTAMLFPPIQDTATSDGTLLILGDYGAVSVDTTQPRVNWQDDPGLVTVSLRNFGAAGARAFAVVNSDVFYRATDGIRDYRMARAETYGWGQTPQSREVTSVLSLDSPELVEFARMAFFDNRLFCTYGPRTINGSTGNAGIANAGMVVLDFDIVGAIDSRQPWTAWQSPTDTRTPAWEGTWTGLQPVELVTGNFVNQEQLLIFSLDSDNSVRLYSMSRSNPFDPDSTPIQAVIETRAFDYTKPFDEKLLYGGDLWVSELWGNVSIAVSFRPDTFACWTTWQTLMDCASYQTAVATCGVFLPTPLPQSRSRVKLFTPPEVYDPTTNWDMRRGMTHQMRLEITGRVRLEKFRLHALTYPEETLNS